MEKLKTSMSYHDVDWNILCHEYHVLISIRYLELFHFSRTNCILNLSHVRGARGRNVKHVVRKHKLYPPQLIYQHSLQVNKPSFNSILTSAIFLVYSPKHGASEWQEAARTGCWPTYSSSVNKKYDDSTGTPLTDQTVRDTIIKFAVNLHTSC